MIPSCSPPNWPSQSFPFLGMKLSGTGTGTGYSTVLTGTGTDVAPEINFKFRTFCCLYRGNVHRTRRIPFQNLRRLRDSGRWHHLFMVRVPTGHKSLYVLYFLEAPLNMSSSVLKWASSVYPLKLVILGVIVFVPYQTVH